MQKKRLKWCIFCLNLPWSWLPHHNFNDFHISFHNLKQIFCEVRSHARAEFYIYVYDKADRCQQTEVIYKETGTRNVNNTDGKMSGAYAWFYCWKRMTTIDVHIWEMKDRSEDYDVTWKYYWQSINLQPRSKNVICVWKNNST